MEYKVLSFNTTRLMEEAVAQHVENGWEPQGGISVAADPNTTKFLFFQAMTREQTKGSALFRR